MAVMHQSPFVTVYRVEVERSDESREHIRKVGEQRVEEANEIAKEHDMKLLDATVYRASMTDGTVMVKIQYDGNSCVQVQSLVGVLKRPLDDCSAADVVRTLLDEDKQERNSFTYEEENDESIGTD
jgi:hypothetical protein